MKNVLCHGHISLTNVKKKIDILSFICIKLFHIFPHFFSFQAREETYEKEKEQMRLEKEKEIARLRAQQERAKDKQAEKVCHHLFVSLKKIVLLFLGRIYNAFNNFFLSQDALRARRNQEEAEREWRKKVKEEASKK